MQGCYVNSEKAILATFDHTSEAFPKKKDLSNLRFSQKTLSGSQGRNLLDIGVFNSGGTHGDEQNFLCA